MAKPTNTIRGFIAVTIDDKATLLALHNIISVKAQGEYAEIAFTTPLDSIIEGMNLQAKAMKQYSN